MNIVLFLHEISNPIFWEKYEKYVRCADALAGLGLH